MKSVAYVVNEPGVVCVVRFGRRERRDWGLTCDWVLCSHLAQEEEGYVYDESDESIADKDARGPAFSEGLSGAEEEACAYRPRYGDHLHLSR